MPASSATFDRLTAWAVRLPLRGRFRSSATSMHTRDLVIVRVDTGPTIGWGEAAPVPGHTADTLASVWDRIGNGDWSDGLTGAAVAQAIADVAAKQAAEPLWRHLGGSQPVWASAAIGVSPNGEPDVALLRTVVAAGYRHAKLKITRETKPESLATIRNEFPDIAIGLDANGSLGTEPSATIRSIDQIGFAYLEQPGPAPDLVGHRRLRDLLNTRVVLDESAATPADVASIVKERAADAVNLKGGRFGPTRTLRLATTLAEAGILVRLGGLVESGIGRAHSIALATRREFSMVGDIAASDLYFEDDLVTPSWRLSDGRLLAPDLPGIGVEVDPAAIDRYAVDRFSTE